MAHDTDDIAGPDAATDDTSGSDYEFTDVDRDKPVVNSEGKRVGTVERVMDGDAEIRADPEMPGELRDALGVGDPDGDSETTSTLQHEHVESVTDDSVRLRNVP